MIFKNQEYAKYEGELDVEYHYSYLQEELTVFDARYFISKKELIKKAYKDETTEDWEGLNDLSDCEFLLSDLLDGVDASVNVGTDEYGRDEDIRNFSHTAVAEGTDSDNVYFKVIYIEE